MNVQSLLSKLRNLEYGNPKLCWNIGKVYLQQTITTLSCSYAAFIHNRLPAVSEAAFSSLTSTYPNFQSKPHTHTFHKTTGSCRSLATTRNLDPPHKAPFPSFTAAFPKATVYADWSKIRPGCIYFVFSTCSRNSSSVSSLKHKNCLYHFKCKDSHGMHFSPCCPSSFFSHGIWRVAQVPRMLFSWFQCYWS